MEQLEARITSVKPVKENLYEALLTLRYRGRDYTIRVSKLVRRPGHVAARISGDYVLVEMKDTEGLPLATCCIHIGHLEKGCMDCPSLIVPPRES